MAAYYNEIEPFAAAWLRNLIAAGHIAPGDVDERSIKDVEARDLDGYTQCHFFAGIGVWSYALRCAGWPDDRPVWTGSCPCQPFSVAGKGRGTADARHLWPDFYRLIGEHRPHTIFGEQVSSPDGLAWFDNVSDQLEATGYAVGALDTCAAGVGAPHLRQRLYWVGHSDTKERLGEQVPVQPRGQNKAGFNIAGASGFDGGALAHAHDQGSQIRSGSTAGRSVVRLEGSAVVPRGPVNGSWANAEWIPCSDGKSRPAQPGAAALVNGFAGRVGRIRAYGNALVAAQAETFIKAYLETLRSF